MQTWSFVVHGRVQGVGFRHHVKHVAEEMMLAGEVYNRPDGSVMIVAEFEEDRQVQEFVAAIHRGPGEIDDIRRRHHEFYSGYLMFEITGTRP